MTTMEQMVEAAFDVLWPLQEWEGEKRICRAAATAAIRAALPILADALVHKIGREDVTAHNVNEFLSEIMEGK